MKRYAVLLCGSVLAWSSAQGAEIHYDYAQLDVIIGAELENGDEFDYDGVGLEVSAHFVPSVFGFAEANSRRLELDDFDAAFSTFSVGAGVRHGFVLGAAGQALDVFGTLSLENYQLMSSTRGWGVGGGLRWVPMPEVEIAVGLRYVDYGSLDEPAPELDGDVDGIRYSLRGLVHLTRNSALLVDLRFGDLEIENGDSMDLKEREVRLGYRWYY